MEYQYKNDQEFEAESHRICYIPENADPDNRDEHYNYHDFLALCNNNKKLTRIVFDLCEWESPDTVLARLEMDGEIDDECNIIEQL
jgi:hypothetical protein